MRVAAPSDATFDACSVRELKSELGCLLSLPQPPK